MDETIERIIQKEYVMLGKVNNRGGRAACQDHFAVFRTMRASQFLVWPDFILRSYLDDLKQAEAVGRNLVFEKYAWMMMYALAEEFKKVCHVLPVFSPERRERMQETVAVQVAWAEEFAARYPTIGARGRPLHTEEDTPESTSVETYMRGELATYSERTEKRYHTFVLSCREQGRNLTTEVRENQARLQGWHSLEDVERSYREKRGQTNFLEVLK